MVVISISFDGLASLIEGLLRIALSTTSCSLLKLTIRCDICLKIVLPLVKGDVGESVRIEGDLFMPDPPGEREPSSARGKSSPSILVDSLGPKGLFGFGAVPLGLVGMVTSELLLPATGAA